MTEDDRDKISSPAQGLMIYCTNCGTNGEAQLYDGKVWVNVNGGEAAAAAVSPRIGEYRDGGIVFYVAPEPTDLNGDGSPDLGLVCAVNDQSAGVQWFNGDYTTTGATAMGIGSGQTNTTTIISKQGDGTYAASVCDNLSLNGYNDWFLPSKDELKLIYMNKASIDATATANGGSGFVSDYYWSSTETSSDQALYIYYGFMSRHGRLKIGTFSVRAIRVF